MIQCKNNQHRAGYEKSQVKVSDHGRLILWLIDDHSKAEPHCELKSFEFKKYVEVIQFLIINTSF